MQPMYYRSARSSGSGQPPRPRGAVVANKTRTKGSFRLSAVVAVVAVLVIAVIGISHGSNSKAPIHAQAAAITVASKKAATVAVAPTPSACATNTLAHYVLVSISQQHLWACSGTTLVQQTAVTTGASGLTNVDDATPTGTWQVYAKERDQHLTGSDANGPWDDYVQYWMPFDGEVGFHDASWQTFAFGSSLYTTQGSHGCVHLPTSEIAWLYNWAPVGTTVTVEA